MIFLIIRRAGGETLAEARYGFESCRDLPESSGPLFEEARARATSGAGGSRPGRNCGLDKMSRRLFVWCLMEAIPTYREGPFRNNLLLLIQMAKVTAMASLSDMTTRVLPGPPFTGRPSFYLLWPTSHRHRSSSVRCDCPIRASDRQLVLLVPSSVRRSRAPSNTSR